MSASSSAGGSASPSDTSVRTLRRENWLTTSSCTSRLWAKSKKARALSGWGAPAIRALPSGTALVPSSG